MDAPYICQPFVENCIGEAGILTQTFIPSTLGCKVAQSIATVINGCTQDSIDIQAVVPTIRQDFSQPFNVRLPVPAFGND